MVILNLMLCLTLPNFRMYPKKHIAQNLASMDSSSQNSALSVLEYGLLLKALLLAMNKHGCVYHLKELPKYSAELMFSTHHCSPRWSKSEAMDKMPIGKKTHTRGEPERPPWPMGSHIKEKRHCFLVLILQLTTLVFSSQCFNFFGPQFLHF